MSTPGAGDLDSASSGSAATDGHLNHRRAAAITGIAALLLVAPLFRSPPRDSFPLSTFPMFSTLIDPIVDVDYVVGIAADGSDITLDPSIIAGTDEVIVAGSIVTQAVRAGSDQVDALCLAAADRAGRGTEVVRVEVRTDRFDAIRWFDGEREPLASTLHGSCDVG